LCTVNGTVGAVRTHNRYCHPSPMNWPTTVFLTVMTTQGWCFAHDGGTSVYVRQFISLADSANQFKWAHDAKFEAKRYTVLRRKTACQEPKYDSHRQMSVVLSYLT
jgi:hypothetical protein